jgi:hypothetical protein
MVEVLSTPESRVGFYHEVFNEPEREQILTASRCARRLALLRSCAQLVE